MKFKDLINNVDIGLEIFDVTELVCMFGEKIVNNLNLNKKELKKLLKKICQELMIDINDVKNYHIIDFPSGKTLIITYDTSFELTNYEEWYEEV